MFGRIMSCQSTLIAVLKGMSHSLQSIYGGPTETLAEHQDKLALPGGGPSSKPSDHMEQ